MKMCQTKVEWLESGGPRFLATWLKTKDRKIEVGLLKRYDNYERSRQKEANITGTTKWFIKTEPSDSK